MTGFELRPLGHYSLAASTRFLEGFAPSGVRPATDDRLRLAFPLEPSWQAVAISLWQDGPIVRGQYVGDHRAGRCARPRRETALSGHRRPRLCCGRASRSGRRPSSAALSRPPTGRLLVSVRGGPPLGPGAAPRKRLKAFVGAYLDYAWRNLELLVVADPVLGAELVLAPLAGDFLRHLAVERELERDAIRAGLLRLVTRLARS